MATGKKLQTPWANIADMMSSLMMVFLLISVSYSVQVKTKSDELQKVTDQVTVLTGEYTDNRKQIYDSLDKKFSSKFEEWSAVLDEDSLTLRFENPALLFDPGSENLTIRFQEILSEFWPEYVAVLSRYSGDILEVRIEGHTSSEWAEATLDESYFKNMWLSQSRTRSTLRSCYNLTPEDDKEWVRKYVTANGMSFSRPMMTSDFLEDPVKSRRVEFTVVVNSTKAIQNIRRVLND
jgi:outer membrane protein OmpA-like peptidoglycan-associated protein